MGTTASSSPDTEKEEKNENEEAKDTEKIPSVFVNYEFLNFDTQQSNRKVYEIDGNTYTDNLNAHEEFEEFKLYAERVDERYAEIETLPKKLKIEVQEVDRGYIINCSIFINTRHYNTIINIFEDCLNCFVCDDIVLEENCDSHVTTEDHKRNLEACPIFEEYKLSIFRLKNDHYHCGLCNVVFHENNISSHFKGQTHSNNKIFATKEAAKIMKRNALDRNENNDTQNKENDEGMRNEINEISNETDNIALDSHVSVKTKNNTFQISYYTWNMIVISKDNSFYCMACKLKDSIDNLREHIIDISHKNNLETFKINELYENHLIRQDAQWSHCSTCNTVHYLGGTDLHITRHDKGKTFAETAKTIVISENKSNDNRNENNDSPSTSNAPTKINPNVVNINDVTRNDILEAIINDKCHVFLFGIFKIQVSLLSLNVVFYNQLGFFYCGLCKVKLISQAVHDHIRSPIHVSRLNSTPAVQYYGYNYIRSIDNLPHCGICHMIIQPSMLLLHLQDPSHIMQTNLALGLLNLPPPPPQVAKVTANEKNDNEKKIIKNKIDVENVIDSNRINGTKNKIDEIKNVINETRITINDETKNIINASVKIEKADVYLEVNESKIREIELKCDEDDNTGIFDAEVEVWTRKARLQVALISFNTLVPIGDGDRYCFGCGIRVECETVENHIRSISHMETIKDIKFLEEYCNNLIRQKGPFYHCALCNTIVRRSELINHTEWTTHEEQIKINKTNVNKKERNSVEYQNKVFPTVKEVITNKRFKDIIIIWSYIIKPSDSIDSISPSNARNPKHEEAEEIPPANEVTSKTNKTIIIDDLNLKIALTWDAWHSIIPTKNKYKCIICNEKLNEVYVDIHINSESHMQRLDKPFTTKYFPALIREVNTDMLHCATCNTVLYNKSNIRTHIQGGKHKRCLEDLLIKSSDDSNEDIIIV